MDMHSTTNTAHRAAIAALEALEASARELLAARNEAEAAQRRLRETEQRVASRLRGELAAAENAVGALPPAMRAGAVEIHIDEEWGEMPDVLHAFMVIEHEPLPTLGEVATMAQSGLDERAAGDAIEVIEWEPAQ